MILLELILQLTRKGNKSPKLSKKNIKTYETKQEDKKGSYPVSQMVPKLTNEELDKILNLGVVEKSNSP